MNFSSQIVSLITSQATTYSTFKVELAIQDCFTLFQLMAPPPKVNTYPEVDFLKSISGWKSESI